MPFAHGDLWMATRSSESTESTEVEPIEEFEISVPGSSRPVYRVFRISVHYQAFDKDY